jgi:hypothetical protein
MNGHSNCSNQAPVSEIVAASEKAPLLASFLRVDMVVVREILNREELVSDGDVSSYRTPNP